MTDPIPTRFIEDAGLWAVAEDGECRLVSKDTCDAMLQRIRDLEAERDEATKLMTQYARESGEAKGRLEMSEAAGMVDMWREHALAADKRREAAEALLGKAGEVLERVNALLDSFGEDDPDDLEFIEVRAEAAALHAELGKGKEAGEL